MNIVYCLTLSHFGRVYFICGNRRLKHNNASLSLVLSAKFTYLYFDLCFTLLYAFAGFDNLFALLFVFLSAAGFTPLPFHSNRYYKFGKMSKKINE